MMKYVAFLEYFRLIKLYQTELENRHLSGSKESSPAWRRPTFLFCLCILCSDSTCRSHHIRTQAIKANDPIYSSLFFSLV